MRRNVVQTLPDAYMLTETGFKIRLDCRLYERPAVLKALFRFQDQFIISFELEDHFIDIYFDSNDAVETYAEIVRQVYKELSFQMIRRDVMRETQNIRELLVGRALYASCIEQERGEVNAEPQDMTTHWEEDAAGIFASWTDD